MSVKIKINIGVAHVNEFLVCENRVRFVFFGNDFAVLFDFGI